MSLARWVYRLRQFWHAISARPTPKDLAQAADLLSPEQFSLFQQLQLSEQAHALLVLAKLRERGDNHPALLQAALLHDIGKIKTRLSIWDRTWIVLGKGLFPGKMKTWGQGQAQGWKKAFVVSAQHAAWGAQLAADANLDALAVALIRRHQDSLPGPPQNMEDELLQILQSADDES